ncbi:MAG TPA: glycine--tRNA ligase subunit beta [Anaerolineaceae bacterium]
MTQPMDFQTIIFTLQRYWADQGCLIWQPYYNQVGAGTMNPATVLRVLGPEPWNVAYVEPSVRPDDGRYGENPNRLQQHYQFQVILKPDPGNPQELYLRSLMALGIDPKQHDIRFVEDNWESPALGAWGLGWEVWLDGQEITQYTYFQQAGGQVLNPVSVELTYGIERIAMTLQRVRHFRDLRWNSQHTYGDVNLQGEQEHSRYYFDVADVNRLQKMYELFEQEAESALAAGLVLPAHDYILKCSHTFNVLDSRGAIGVTERQALFGRMRDLSRRVSEAYLADRQRQGYPWLPQETGTATQKPGIPAPKPTLEVNTPQDFLLEIGVEELPAADLDSALFQLNERIPLLLNELNLAHGAIRIFGTPRRLVVFIEKLAARQPDRELVIKGPPADRAFDQLGAATKAGEGFARSRGVALADLQVREIDGGRYACALVHETGKPAVNVLAEALPGVVAGIRFEKSMRWNESQVAFSRPIRWLLALFGETVIPFEYAGLIADRRTRGLRFQEPETCDARNPADYFQFLAGQGILLDPAERKAAIARQVEHLSRQAGGSGEVNPALLDEVNNLVEAPTAFLGTFDPSHLELPSEVLISVMKKHQRYFPVQTVAGKLLPCFIGVRNGDQYALNVVTDGNEQVVRARFADASFFVREDLQHPLEFYLPKLGTLTFQVKLGSMLDKARRVEKLVEKLAAMLHFPIEDIQTARRAASLCKADLVTHMVIEMTSLQGIMGKYYALKSGEAEAVADAIYEHYLPRFAGDDLPKANAGLLVGIADRLDTLAGLFAAGLAPTGTKDPFAQRRAALGLVQVLIERGLDFDLQRGLALAAEALPIAPTPESQNACLDFIVGRMRTYLLDQGFRYDIVEALITAQGTNPAGVGRGVQDLAKWVAKPEWSTILPAYARCVRITREFKEKFSVQPGRFIDPVEKDLYNYLLNLEDATIRPGSVNDLLERFTGIIPVINSFFNAVLVMDNDPAVRANRLGLLQRVAALAYGTVDLSVLEGF